MVHRVLFWAGFGVAARAWQLGIELRPFFHKSSLWVYPVFATTGGAFGYWLDRVDKRQTAILDERKAAILAKRARKLEAAAATEATA